MTWGDDPPKLSGDPFIWCLVFLVLGILVIFNRPDAMTGLFILGGGISVAVGVAFGIAAWLDWMDDR